MKNPWKTMSEERREALAKICADAWLAIPPKGTPEERWARAIGASKDSK